MNKTKDGILHAFDDAVSHREDEVRRSESQREMPGWNFCTFFILKESCLIEHYVASNWAYRDGILGKPSFIIQ